MGVEVIRTPIDVVWTRGKVYSFFVLYLSGVRLKLYSTLVSFCPFVFFGTVCGVWSVDSFFFLLFFFSFF